MTRGPVAESYPEVPEGFQLLREYDPDQGLNYFRVKFTATLEQAITDEMLGHITLSKEILWGTVINELQSNLARRFR